AYIARATVPSGSTNSIHVAKIADAFASISEDFRLIVFEGGTKATLREVYGIRNEFPIYRIDKGADTRLSQIKWARRAVGLARKQGCNAIVTRDPFCAVVAVIRGMDAVLDLHGDIKHLTGRFYRMLKWKWFVDNKRFHLVTISQGLKDYYVQNYGLTANRITVLPDGADLADFEPYSGNALKLNKDSLHIGYFGKILVGKGIDLIRRIAIADSDDVYDIYGGTLEEAEKETGSSFPENVVFHGKVNNKEIPAIMCDMDVLILPNQEKLMNMGEDIGRFTSPLKLFEYMASGRAIIASDLPVIREVLSEDNAYLADASDENDWVRCINEIKRNSHEADKVALKAKEDVKRYSWKARAQAMINLTL
ncbi:MAG: glycosyltransferase family 4 protein, partial [Butyrivibrio sp.]|nr:glycosyltransferase family 4 protein [Butyrivibrio sp.]